MVRFFAILLVAMAALAAWLTRPLWQGGPSFADVARIPASERLTAVAQETLCRPPLDAETVKWDSRPFETPDLYAALTWSAEGRRVSAIRQAYLKVLHRDPFAGDCAGLRQWVEQDLPVDEVERRLGFSPESRRIADVRQVFRETLGQDPAGWDTSTLRYWVESGMPLGEIRARLAAQRPMIGVYYFTWYQLMNGRWGNLATAVAADAPRPSLGLYESGRVEIIDRHISQIASAGFDFVMVNVVAGDTRSWANAHAFFARLKGTPLKAVVMLDELYRTERAVKAEWVEKVKAEFIGYANYLSYHDRPLVLLFASRLDFAVPGVLLRNVYWTPTYTPGGNLFNLDLVLYPHDWPFWVDTPQPVMNGVVPVMPGYIDTHLGRDDPMVHPRNGGRLYHEQWQHALKQRPEIITVYSWNE